DEGVTIGTDDAMAFVSAVALLDPGRLEDVYWSGRTTLTHGRSHIPTYNACFTRFFLGGKPDTEPQAVPVSPPGAESDAVFTVPSVENPLSGSDEEQATLGLAASGIAVQQAKDFADCTDDELMAIRRIIASLRFAPPMRRTRRHRTSSSGQVLDMRTMARQMMRKHGEPVELGWRIRRERPRRVVLILDISGSMADYSRNLMQFAHSVRRGGRKVEVFCFGTRLTRVTGALRHRDADEALARASEQVVDWSGGTQIGSSLEEFVKRYGRRGTARGAIVVICSDGLDRGDPAVLDAAMERLDRLAYRIVWMNPMMGETDDEYVAASLGMSVAMPHVDLLWSGHNLASLSAFADTLPEIR
ncbi:MAG: vWA domain-containing protein, partial [Acidimicrobiia bacterium]